MHSRCQIWPHHLHPTSTRSSNENLDNRSNRLHRISHAVRVDKPRTRSDSVVRGAGSLEVAPGRRLIDQPDFPSEWKEGASKTAAFLDLLKAESELNWTFLSPAANLVPGERTGNYRSGGDTLITDESGDSRISVQDLAVAMLDEVEQPMHARKRFTVAYCYVGFRSGRKNYLIALASSSGSATAGKCPTTGCSDQPVML
jgi:putative NADH-flavin reductase